MICLLLPKSDLLSQCSLLFGALGRSLVPPGYGSGGFGSTKNLSILSSSASHLTLTQILLESSASDFGFQQHTASLLGSWGLLRYFLLFLYVSKQTLDAVTGLELPNRPGLWLHFAAAVKLCALAFFHM